jgi:hypothetical protein
MKVLRKVCAHCGYIALFSVEVLCRPHTAVDVGPVCPECGEPRSVVATATELDMEEVRAEPDAALMLKSIQKFEQAKPERG